MSFIVAHRDGLSDCHELFGGSGVAVHATATFYNLLCLLLWVKGSNRSGKQGHVRSFAAGSTSKGCSASAGSHR